MDFDSSILKKVKERLYGVDTATQAIPSFEESILFLAPKETQVVSVIETQNTEKPQKTVSKPLRPTLKTAAVALPQLELDLSDFQNAPVSTQRIDSHPEGASQLTQLTQLPHLSQSTQNVESEESAPLVTAETQIIPDSKETQLLESEIARASLTDEEEDLNDDANTTVDSSIQKTVTTRAELDQIERDLSEQKLKKNIQPAFAQKSFNPIDRLMEAFDSESEHEDPLNSENAASALSPNTSPIQAATAAKGDIQLDDDEDSDFEIPDAIDVLNNGIKALTPKKKKSPITDYALRLKHQLMSSPSNSSRELISLDDSDDDLAIEEPVVIPSLSKEQELLVKQKFSKKHPRKLPKKRDLFTSLRRANTKQLRQMKLEHPDAELIEEIEKDEEEMGNLLEREMERARRVRKKEKQQEKAKAALLRISNGDLNDSDDMDYKSNEEEEVPDSDDVADSDIPESGQLENEDDLENDEDGSTVFKRAKRIILSDDDDIIDEEAAVHVAKPASKSSDLRNDDSYMFGGASLDIDEEAEDVVTHIHSDQARPDTPLDSIIQDGFDESLSPKLFLNLPPRSQQNISMDDSMSANVTIEPRHVPSFQEMSSTQFSAAHEQETQKDYIGTQADEVLPSQVIPYSDDEDEDFALAVKRGRQSVLQTKASADIQPSSDGEDVDPAEKAEILKQKLELYEAKIRRKELKARKLRKEMERRGVKGVVEGEAEESEDEWKGIGGIDQDLSDKENSEDERMIDNNFDLVLNDDDVRKKFMEQYQIKDRQELEKLIDDIKNHRLTKRARSSRFDVELSDEEDEILMAYRRKKLEEQKQRLLENKKVNSLLKSEKSKAFFESIAEEMSPHILLDSENEDSVEETQEESPSIADSQVTEGDAESVPMKKHMRLDEAYVQKQLSFLCSTEESKYIQIQQDADFQHGVDEEPVEDIAALKSRCKSNLYSFSGVDSQKESNKRDSADLLTDDDENDDFGHVFKKPSMVSSFKLYHEKQVGQVSTGSFSGVTVNKQYKVASGSKASITYISKNVSLKQTGVPMKSAHTQAIEKRVDHAKQNSSLFRKGSAFA